MQADQLQPGVVAKDSKTEVTSEKLIRNVNEYVSSVSFYVTVENHVSVLRRSVVPDAIPVRPILAQIDQVSLQNFPLLFEIRTLNVSNPKSQHYDSKPYYVVSLNDKFRKIIKGDDMAFYDNTFKDIKSMMAAAKILSEYSRSFISEVPHWTESITSALERVDLKLLGPRNMELYREAIVDTSTRNSFFSLVRTRYIKRETTATSNENFPLMHRKSTIPGVEDSYKNFDTYTVPLAAIEVWLDANARSLFHEWYQHPREALEIWRKYETPGMSLAPSVIEQAAEARVYIRVLRHMFFTMGIEHMYKSPNLRKQILRQLDELTIVAVPLANRNDRLNRFLRAMQLSQTRASELNTIGQYVDRDKLADIMTMIYKANINPNLYRINLALASNGELVTMYWMLALILFQPLMPPLAINYISRLRANNVFIREVLSYRNTTTVDQLRAEILRIHGLRMPSLSGTDAWFSAQVDWCALVYATLIGQFAQRERDLATILSTYFNDITPTAILGTVEVCGETEHKSTYYPWHRGVLPDRMVRHTGEDEFRRVRNMEPNGALLLNEVSDPDIGPKMDKYEERCDMYNRIYTSSPIVKSTNDHIQIRRMMREITMSGLNSLSVIIRVYNQHLGKFSTSIVADGNVRQNIFYKESPTLNEKYILGGLFFLDSREVPTASEKPTPLYQGITLALDLRLFQLCYAYVHNSVRTDANVIGASSFYKVSDIVTKRQIEDLANKLTKVILGTDSFNAREIYGMNDADEVEWKQFLEEALTIPDTEVPIFARYKALITSLQEMMVKAQMGMPTYEVDHFYLCKGAVMGMHPEVPEVLAASTVYSEKEMEVIGIINSVDEYYLMLTQMVDPDNDPTNPVGELDYINSFDAMWQSLDTMDRTQEYGRFKDMKTRDGRKQGKRSGAKLQVIRVNMNAKVNLHVHLENGNYDGFDTPQPQRMEKDFRAKLDALGENPTITDINKLEAFVIDVHVVYNNIGGASGTKVIRNMMHRITNVIDSLPQSQLIVPYEAVKERVFTGPEDLFNFFSNDVTVRKRKYEVLDSFEPRFIATDPLASVQY